MILRPSYKQIVTLGLATVAGVLLQNTAWAQGPSRSDYRNAPPAAYNDDNTPDDSAPAPKKYAEQPRAGSKAYLEQRRAAQEAQAAQTSEPVRPSASMKPTGPTRGYGDGAQMYPNQRASATTTSSNAKYRTAQAIGVNRDSPMESDAAGTPRPAPPVEDIGPRRSGSMVAPPEPAVVREHGAVNYGPEPMGDSGCGCGCNGGSCGGSCTSGGCGCHSGGCGCGSCGQGCGICIGLCDCSFLDNLTIFAGPQAYKGPLDRAANGNFGFHEGLNTGFAVCDCLGWGMQVGFQATQSDFETGVLATDQRDQVFVTGGAFHRPQCGCGFTAGIVADYMHDDFYAAMDLLQVRAAIGYAWGQREIGFEAIVGVDEQTIETLAFGRETFAPRDQYRFYVKRNWCEGAESRVFAGFTEDSDFEFGTELRVPLSESLAVQGGFTYMIPNERDRNVANEEETWNVGMSLVWHPYQRAHCYSADPYRPMFNVADNGIFMVHHKN